MEQTTAVHQHHRGRARPSRRVVVFGVVLALYVLLTLGVIFRSPLLTLDQDVLRLDLRDRYPGLWHWFHTYVMLGQRGPAALAALPWFAWRAWKSRSARPLIMLGSALLVLNLSVGVVKIATGRLGPRATNQVHAVFEGGDIFPSGHVSNAVVLYGVMAMLAVNWRRTAAAVATGVSITLGLTTVYLDTHWLTDVFGGWLAGALVLIVLPWVMPYTERLWNFFGAILTGALRLIRGPLRRPPVRSTPASGRSPQRPARVEPAGHRLGHSRHAERGAGAAPVTSSAPEPAEV